MLPRLIALPDVDGAFVLSGMFDLLFKELRLSDLRLIGRAATHVVVPTITIASSSFRHFSCLRQKTCLIDVGP